MAEALRVPAETLTALADRIALVPSIGLGERALAERQIAESFEVWLLEERSILVNGLVVGEAARDTGYRHHQIRSEAGSAQYARSETKERGLQFAGLFTSPLAENIDRAVDLIDRDTSIGGDVVRLLEAPSRQLAALWLPTNPAGRFVMVSQIRRQDGLATIDETAFLRGVRSRPPAYRIAG